MTHPSAPRPVPGPPRPGPHPMRPGQVPARGVVAAAPAIPAASANPMASAPPTAPAPGEAPAGPIPARAFADLDRLPVAEHVAVFEAEHARLQHQLSTIDRL